MVNCNHETKGKNVGFGAREEEATDNCRDGARRLVKGTTEQHEHVQDFPIPQVLSRSL